MPDTSIITLHLSSLDAACRLVSPLSGDVSLLWHRPNPFFPEDDSSVEDARTETSAKFDAIAIVSSPEILSLSLKLPFKNTQQLRAVLDSEVFDSIPFESDHFVSRYETGQIDLSGNTRIRCNSLPAPLYGDILSLLGWSGIRPKVLTTICSLLHELPQAYPRLREGLFFILGRSGNDLILGMLDDGVLLAERVISAADDATEGRGSSIPSPIRCWTTQFLLAGEQAAGRTIDGCLTLGPAGEFTDALPDLDRRLEGLPAGEAADLWSRLAALHLNALQARPSAMNFRPADLSSHPRIPDITKAVRIVAPFLAVVAAIAFFAAITIFLVRNRQIASYQDTLRDRIHELVPQFSSADGEEVVTLQKQNQTLDAQLKELGTSSALSPMESFALLSKELPAGSNISLRKINIRTSRIVIEGSAPDYSAVEKVERMLRRRREIFCRIKKDTTGASGQPDKRSFSFDISLCDA